MNSTVMKTYSLVPEGIHNYREARKLWMQRFEREYLLQLLQRNDGDARAAARDCNIDDWYFRRLLRRHNITPKHWGPGRTKYNSDVAETAKQLREAGKTFAEIAEELGVSLTWAYRKVNGYVAPPRARKTNRYSIRYPSEIFTEAQRLRDEGLLLREISARLGVSVKWVSVHTEVRQESQDREAA